MLSDGLYFWMSVTESHSQEGKSNDAYSKFVLYAFCLIWHIAGFFLPKIDMKDISWVL
jgi:hypothetical protein